LENVKDSEIKQNLNTSVGQGGVQAVVQNGVELDNLKFRREYAVIQRGRRLAGLGHKPSKLAITGSNPVDRTTFEKYSKLHENLIVLHVFE
jgi:hypothetical protein